MRWLAVVLTVATTVLCAADLQPTRRVNWWFNALNTSFGEHEARTALAHRKSITGVYQYIQPNGFIIGNDGNIN
eukprot:gene3232-7365_t